MGYTVMIAIVSAQESWKGSLTSPLSPAFDTGGYQEWENFRYLCKDSQVQNFWVLLMDLSRKPSFAHWRRRGAKWKEHSLEGGGLSVHPAWALTNQLDVGTRTRSAFLSGYLNGLFRMLMVRPLPWKCWLGRSRLRPHLPMGLIFRKFLEQMHQMSSNPPTTRIFKVKSKQVQQNPHWYVPRPLPLKGKNFYQAVSGINILCLLIWPASSEKTTPSCIDRGLLKLIETSSYLRPLSIIERSHFV